MGFGIVQPLADPTAGGTDWTKSFAAGQGIIQNQNALTAQDLQNQSARMQLGVALRGDQALQQAQQVGSIEPLKYGNPTAYAAIQKAENDAAQSRASVQHTGMQTAELADKMRYQEAAGLDQMYGEMLKQTGGDEQKARFLMQPYFADSANRLAEHGILNPEQHQQVLSHGFDPNVNRAFAMQSQQRLDAMKLDAENQQRAQNNAFRERELGQGDRRLNNDTAQLNAGIVNQAHQQSVAERQLEISQQNADTSAKAADARAKQAEAKAQQAGQKGIFATEQEQKGYIAIKMTEQPLKQVKKLVVDRNADISSFPELVFSAMQKGSTLEVALRDLGMNDKQRENYIAYQNIVMPKLRIESGAAIGPTEYVDQFRAFGIFPGASTADKVRGIQQIDTWRSAVSKSIGSDKIAKADSQPGLEGAKSQSAAGATKIMLFKTKSGGQRHVLVDANGTPIRYMD